MRIVIAFLIVAVVFGVLEWRWPSIRGQRRLRPSVVTDLLYLEFSTTLGKVLTPVVVAVSVLVMARLLGLSLSVEQLKGLADRETWASRQPIGLQMLEFLVLADFIGYWSHRGFHTFGRLWRIHAIHHSSTELDWLSSVRVHPLNDALSTTFVAAPLLLLGFDPRALAAYVPFLTLYAIAIHANVAWDIGPLRGVIVGPVFHRWHHSREPEAVNKNFAPLFVIWDRLFGTLYLPEGQCPRNFGVKDAAVPAGFISQLAYPLR
jgi:sterol desaturase/sphingolipid hydroxylase (fatty acid hydroxylase superfamily)